MQYTDYLCTIIQTGRGQVLPGFKILNCTMWQYKIKSKITKNVWNKKIIKERIVCGKSFQQNSICLFLQDSEKIPAVGFQPFSSSHQDEEEKEVIRSNIYIYNCWHSNSLDGTWLNLDHSQHVCTLRQKVKLYCWQSNS